MVRIRSNVRGVDKTLNAIRRDIHRGMKSSANTLVSNGKQHARQVITTNQAIFNAEVYRKFRDAEVKNNSSHVRVKLYNTADHASVLENGAQYTARGPPVKALLPWVSRKMSWRPDFGRDDDGRPNAIKGFSKSTGGGSKNETLDVAGETRTYPDGWNTYDPLTVETVPNNEVYEGQDVELLNIEDETFVSGVITHKHAINDEYTVDVGDDEYFITTPGDPVSDPYKIIANEPFDELSQNEQLELVEGAVDGINAGPHLDSRRESIIRTNLKGEVTEAFDDNQKAYNLFQRHDNIFSGENLADNVDGMHQSNAGGTYNLYIDDTGARSTQLHEMMHGSHKYDGLNSKVYPSNDQDFYNNLFNADGTNAAGESWDVSDLLLQDSTEDPLGLPDDGSIPEVVKARTAGGQSYDYTDSFDTNEWLNPNTQSFEVGDRVKMTTPFSDDPKPYELKNVGLLDADGDVPEDIVTYEMLDVETDNSIDLWVDQDGDFFNMQGIRIDEIAESPTGDSSIPDVELSSDDPVDRLTEATNLAYMEMVWSASELERGGDVNDDVVNVVGRPYSMRAANETYTTVSEMMRANNPRGRFQDRSFLDVDSLSSLDENYPYLIDAWLENFQPSDEVGDILGDWGYNV